MGLEWRTQSKREGEARTVLWSCLCGRRPELEHVRTAVAVLAGES